MTLVISMVSLFYALVVGDRLISRLESNGSTSYVEESNKMWELRCEDAHALVAYSGLALVSESKFQTRFAIAEALGESAAPDCMFEGILGRFVGRLQERLDALPASVPLEKRKVTVAFVGYLYETEVEIPAVLPPAGTVPFYAAVMPGENGRLEATPITRLQAAEYIPLDQLGTTDDCGFATFADDTSTARATAFAKIRARVEGTQLA